jgi:hypothetical protein
MANDYNDVFCGSRSSNWQIQSRLQQPDKTQKANVLTSAADFIYWTGISRRSRSPYKNNYLLR